MTRPRLYLVRHGETDWNAEGRLLSFTDRPLNERGERQAATLAGDLVGIRWDRAFSSPLVRARRTADIVLAARDDAPPLVVDDRLREMDFGPYEGWSERQLEDDPVAASRRRDGAQIPGIESEHDVAERARAVVASLGTAGGTTLVVGHGRMLRILIAVALGLPPSFAQSLRMRNCRPAVLEPGPRHLLLGFNVGDPSAEAGTPGPWLGPAAPPRLYLVRHGETEWNAGRRLQSFTDMPLNARGEAQPSALSSALAGIRWDRAYSSPLMRTRRTAEVILAARDDAPALAVDERLRETHLGSLEGSSEADPAVAAWRSEGIPAAGMEPLEDVAERCRSYLESLDASAGPALVVGHGRALRILIATALGMPASAADLLRVRNCRPAVLEPGPRPILVALNAGDPSFEAQPEP